MGNGAGNGPVFVCPRDSRLERILEPEIEQSEAENDKANEHSSHDQAAPPQDIRLGLIDFRWLLQGQPGALARYYADKRWIGKRGLSAPFLCLIN